LRQVGLLRMLRAAVIILDHASLMLESLKNNECPAPDEVHRAMDMPWAKLLGQIAQALGK